MAQKAKVTLDQKIDRLTKVTERGFGLMEKGFIAVTEDIADLRTEFDTFSGETNENFRSFRAETNENFKALRAEIADIRQRLETLEEELKGVKGYSKEIDTLLARVKRIEKHLGIAVTSH